MESNEPSEPTIKSNDHIVVTEELVSNALGGAKILSFTSESAVPEGEHFLSTILRVAVTYRKQGTNSDEKTKIIIKAYPESNLEEFVKEYELMGRELTCYHKILPRVSEVLGRNLSPRTLGPMKTDSLILEDLTMDGYVMLNRIERMDYKHCVAAMKILAELHASSIIAHDRDPKLFDDIKKETLYVRDNPVQRTFCKHGFTALADEFENIPKLQKYCENLRAISEKLWDAVVDAVTVREDEVNVLTHGDFWTCNILFRYDDKNNIEDVKLVDFQMSRYSSPVIDLITFFNTSIQRRRDIRDLAQIYLNRLNEVVGRNIMSAEVLESLMMRCHCVGLLIAICRLPMCILDISNPMNFVSYSKESLQKNPYRLASRDEKFQEIIPQFLDFYIEIGLL